MSGDWGKGSSLSKWDALTRRQLFARAGMLGLGLASLRVLGSGELEHVSAQTPRRGGTLRYGIVATPPSLDPHSFAGAPSDVLFGMVYSRLVQLAPDLNGVEPELAESWEVSPNLKSYTFSLRPNVRFHDGSRLTADDVAFSFNRIMDPKTGAYVRTLIADVLDQVVAVNETTVRFTMKRPYAAFLAAVALPTAAVVSRRWISGGANPKVTMMGTGPMKFVSLTPNVRLRLARHDQYFEPDLPYLDGIQLQPLPDDTARSTALRSGSVDFIDYTPWKDLAAIRNDRRLRVHSDSASVGAWAFINVSRRPPLNNKMIRQAINWATNRKAILDSTYFGFGSTMESVFMPRSSWAYVPDAPKYGFDPDRARDLIRRSGVQRPLKVELLSVPEIRFLRLPMEVLQANLREVGFDATLTLAEFGQFVKRVFSGDYDMVIWGGGPTFGDPDYFFTYFHSSGQYAKTMGYVNPQVDRLLDEARSVGDRRRRRDLYAQVYRIVIDDAPWVTMVYNEQAEASTARLGGYRRVLGTNWNGIRIAKTWLSS